MGRRFGWRRRRAGWRTWCCTRISAMTGGWIAATPADLSRWGGKWRKRIWKKSSGWQEKKKGPVRTNLLRSRWQQLPEKVVRRLQGEQLRHYLRSVVLPFSAHYLKLFEEQGLTADSIRTIEDLQRIPFTTKADLLNSPEHPQRSREFILIPDEKTLARRPGTIARALVHGREFVKQGF